MYDHTILLAHGSRDPQWAEPFFAIRDAVDPTSASVSLAFMELSDPGIEDAVSAASTNGASRIAILPLFLARGRHLKKDVPEMLIPLRERYSVTIDLLDPIGEQERFRSMMVDLVSDLVDQSLSEATG